MTDMLEALQSDLAELGRPYTPSDVAQSMRALGHVVSDHTLLETLEQLQRHSVGAGVLEGLLREPGITDVLVNGPDDVFVDRGRGLVRADVRFDCDDDVRRLAIRLAGVAGRRLDDAQPYVDGRLPDGTRLHAVLPPIAAPGTLISLRVPATAGFSLDDMREKGSVSPLSDSILRSLIRARVPFLVSGGTGSGKTTLLAALLGLVPHTERIVVVEDARELLPSHPHCLRLEARQANAEGNGAITLTTLVKQALRMRPDRVVLGEVRGPEIADLLMALNTGHEGGCGTIHANSPTDVPTRIEALAALAGMDRPACHAQLGSALRVVVQVVRRPDGFREVAHFGVFVRREDGFTEVVPALDINRGHAQPGTGWPVLEGLLE